MVTSLIFLLIQSAFSSTNITILHTNDLHSYFQGTIEKKNSSVQRVGGYKYLAAQMKEVKTLLKNKGEDFVLTFDAGDFFSGTIYHSIALQNDTAYFPEYEFFNFLDYDGITLGNHEFDGGDSGFNIMMNKVVKLGNKVPIVSTNFNRIDSKKYPILSSKVLILNKDGKEIKIGLLGALGPDGCSVSKASREKNQFIGYSDKKHKAQWRKLNSLLERSAKSLKKQGADIVVLLLHGGTDEDDIIGKKVNGIDVIIAGHTHEVYQKQVNGKIISQAGSYGRFFGVLPIEIKERSALLRSPHEEI
ncbi:MAG: metallophosphoesterase, partial [Halobacteriovoraceae bacterium]|nr:metallophosphoesterase [Halobacteriovoraceae bacterium]